MIQSRPFLYILTRENRLAMSIGKDPDLWFRRHIRFFFQGGLRGPVNDRIKIPAVYYIDRK